MSSTSQGQTIVRNSVFLLVAEILTRGLSLVTVLLIARGLGVEGFGRYSFALVFVSLFANLSNFGLDPLLIKDVARDQGRTETYFSNTLLLKLLTSLVSAALMVLIILLLDYPDATTRAVFIMAAASIFHAMTETATSLCKAIQRMEYSGLINVVRSLFLALLIVLLWNLGMGLLEVFLAYLMAAILQFLVGLGIVASRISRPSLSFSVPLLKNLLRSALPFLLISGIFMIGHRVDVLMLSKMAGDAAVGLYGCAYTPIEVIQAVPFLLTAALFPALSRAFGSSFDAFKHLAMRSLKIFLLLALPATVGVAVLAPGIIDLLFPQEFASASAPLRIFGATIWLFFLQILLGWVLTAMDKLRMMVVFNAVTVLVNIALNLVLIPKYGASGAALALFGSACCGVTLQVVAAYGVGVMSIAGLKLPRILGATLLMGASTHAARELNIFLVVVGSAVLYFLLLWLSKGIDEAEFEVLRSFRPASLGRLGPGR